MFLLSAKKKINSFSSKKKILVSPLEWGLGHAVRCIPIIKELLLHDCEVFIAGEGATRALLESEFPEVSFLPLAGYRIKLSKNKSSFSLKIISQLPNILYTLYNERRWLKKIIKQYEIDAVISDNRPGLYSKQITSVYITHQLLIKTGNLFSAKIARFIHNYFIKKYNHCWVPDYTKEGLAGELSHPLFIPQNVQYIGAISRCEKREYIDKKYDLLIILSGPEPQRTILEKILLNDLLSYKGNALLIRGLPGNAEAISTRNNLKIENHLDANRLCEAIQQADAIISRSGYTTVMDLVKLTKKAILIPTPGQAEQEYLARHLNQKKIFICKEQEKFQLSDALEKLSKFKPIYPQYNMSQYKLVVRDFISSIHTKSSTR
jgi:uncharacterized protein (TIGR00661 family)